jgi:hypothetical protein
MSRQFGEMLKDTLEKMKERIDQANQAWEGNDQQLVKNLEDMTN